MRTTRSEPDVCSCKKYSSIRRIKISFVLVTALKGNRHHGEKREKERCRNRDEERKREITRRVILYCVNLSLNSLPSMRARTREREKERRGIKAAFDRAKCRTYLVRNHFHPFTAATEKKVITYRSRCVCVCMFFCSISNYVTTKKSRERQEKRRRRERRSSEEFLSTTKRTLEEI